MGSNSRRFYYDCEFYEHNWQVELISIGISNWDKSRTLYLENDDFDWFNVAALANSPLHARKTMETARWLMDNVYRHMRFVPERKISPYNDEGHVQGSCSTNYMAQLIQEFVGGPTAKPQLYGYYSAYDHVALANIFGRMSNLPSNFPMYTRDLKQMADETDKLNVPPPSAGEHDALADALWNVDLYDAIMEQRQLNEERKFWRRFTNEIVEDEENNAK